MTSEITITITKQELNLIVAALTDYRLREFPLGRSSRGNPISQRDRKEWAAFGMKVWNKYYTLQGGHIIESVKEVEVK